MTDGFKERREGLFRVRTGYIYERKDGLFVVWNSVPTRFYMGVEVRWGHDSIIKFCVHTSWGVLLVSPT